jgi:hypothetical protein
MKRPKIISIICIAGFISIFFSFLAVFSPWAKKMGDLVPAIYGIIVAAGFMSFIGLWNMKRWGVELFFIVFFVKTLFFVLLNDLGAGTIFSIVSSVLYSIALIRFYPKMDVNL